MVSAKSAAPPPPPPTSTRDQRPDAALASRGTTVPLSRTEHSFPQWIGTSDANTSFVAVRRPGTTNRHTYSAFIATPHPLPPAHSRSNRTTWSPFPTNCRTALYCIALSVVFAFIGWRPDLHIEEPHECLLHACACACRRLPLGYTVSPAEYCRAVLIGVAESRYAFL